MRDLGPRDGSGVGSGEPDRAGAIDVAIRLGVLASFLLLVGILLRPFLGLLVWAAILTVALSPVHDWMTRRMGGRAGLAAGLLTGVALVVVFGPLAYVVANLVASLERIAASLGSGAVLLPPLPAAIGHLPVVGAFLTEVWSTGMAGFGDLLRTHGKDLLHPGEAVLKIVAGLAGSVATFAVAVLAAGFLFIPAPRIAAVAQETAIRIAGPRGIRFVILAGATVRSVARGIIGIALLQAVLMGVVMLLAGIPHAGLLAAAVLILSLAQVAALVVAVPVVIWVWVTHSTLFAVGFTAVFLPLGMMEIPLKPLAMGQGLETPMIVILAGLMGGTVAFGLTGLFLGPLVLAVAWELMRLWLAEGRARPARSDSAPSV